MNLSKTDLKVLSQIGKGNLKIPEIASSLKISISQVYRICQVLIKNKLITISRGIISPKDKSHVNLLLQLVSEEQSIITPLSGTGIAIFAELTQEAISAKDICQKTGLHKTTVMKKIKEGLKINLISKKKNEYVINSQIWPRAKEFLLSLQMYESLIDERIPANSIIYHKNNKEIIFSNRAQINAELTAFSIYKKYGIELRTLTNHYYLPRKPLTKKEILIHSLYIIQKEPDSRNIIFIALFYCKFKKELSKLQHPVLEKINKVLQGEKIPNFITLPEIKDRAEVYNIKV
jgi:predicted transcriptional regulator